jgi:hypothetical protein
MDQATSPTDFAPTKEGQMVHGKKSNISIRNTFI